MRKLFIFLLLLLGGTLQAKTDVLVSITCQKFLVEQIGQEHVSVDVIVPPGANSHTYEPTPRQMVAAQKGKIWFRLGESFEARLLPLLKNTLIIDQRDGLDLIKAGCGCCNRDSYDPHIWLSPRLLKKQAAQIAETLSAYDPEHALIFASNLKNLENALDILDQKCANLLSNCSQKFILLSHPAFGYFCRDYGLYQLSIEMEGREPTPKTLTDLIHKARALNIKTVFLQFQHNPKGGMRVAQEIQANTVYLDPYIENVIENLEAIAHLFAKS